MPSDKFPEGSHSSFTPEGGWGTPLSSEELKAIKWEPGDTMPGGGVVLNVRNYAIDGSTIMAEVQYPDGKKAFSNVRFYRKD